MERTKKLTLPAKKLKRVGIRGCGYALPATIRTNDDPIFQQGIQVMNSQGVREKDLFTGMHERRILRSDEQIEPFLVEAAQQALRSGKLRTQQVDRLYGYVSVAPYLTPNALYDIHRRLELPPEALVLPINSEFSNFLLGVLGAWEAILAGHSKYALVACGTNWSRYMDYSQGHALSVGDGAGAVLIGPDARYTLVDYAAQTLSDQYGAMTMQTRLNVRQKQRSVLVDEQGLPIPTYEITDEAGIHSFQSAGMYGPPQLVHALLRKHGLQGSDIAFIGHQASRVLMDFWAEQIKPAEYLETLGQFGNMTIASYPVNLAYYFEQIRSEYLVMCAVGVGFHQLALLFQRFDDVQG